MMKAMAGFTTEQMEAFARKAYALLRLDPKTLYQDAKGIFTSDQEAVLLWMFLPGKSDGEVYALDLNKWLQPDPFIFGDRPPVSIKTVSDKNPPAPPDHKPLSE